MPHGQKEWINEMIKISSHEHMLSRMNNVDETWEHFCLHVKLSLR